MSSCKAVWAIFGVFLFESSVLGQWIPRIPDIKEALSLTDAMLGVALLSMPVGTLFGFAVAGRIIEQIGLRNACRIFMPLWAMLFISIAFAQNLPQLIVALVFCGFAIGLMETAMNAEAARIEKVAGTRLMSRCHGFWSLGTMIGALSGGALAQWGMPATTHFLLVMPIIAILGYWAATALPKLGGSVTVAESHVSAAAEACAEPQKKPRGLIRLPPRSLLLLCIMPLGIMMVEGAYIDWSAVFMKDTLSAEPFLIAVIYAAFSLTMAAVRLCGDAITNRFGELAVVRVSGVASTVGMLGFALAPSVPVAFIAAALSGAGVAIVFPLVVSAAANRSGHSSVDNVAALNMISFTAFLIAPPVIGFFSEWLGLRIALLLLVPMAFMTVLLAGEVRDTSERTMADGETQ